MLCSPRKVPQCAGLRKHVSEGEPGCPVNIAWLQRPSGPFSLESTKLHGRREGLASAISAAPAGDPSGYFNSSDHCLETHLQESEEPGKGYSRSGMLQDETSVLRGGTAR